LLRPDADQHEAGGAGPPPAPHRQLQEAARGARQGGRSFTLNHSTRAAPAGNIFRPSLPQPDRVQWRGAHTTTRRHPMHRWLRPLVPALLCAPAIALANAPSYGPNLEGFDYPHPVGSFAFTSQGKDVKMDYM